MSHPPLSPYTDAMAAILADNAKQIEEAGGVASLQGREAQLTLSIQEWIGHEVERGTHIDDFITSVLFAFAVNLSNMAFNVSRANGADTEAILAKMESFIHDQSLHIMRNRPETSGTVTPIVKQ